MDSKVYTGTVKKVMDKGFGFIVCKELGKDIFYHNNNLTPALKARGLRAANESTGEKGDEVRFQIENTEKGESAINVELVDASNEDAQETQEGFAA